MHEMFSSTLGGKWGVQVTQMTTNIYSSFMDLVKLLASTLYFTGD